MLANNPNNFICNCPVTSIKVNDASLLIAVQNSFGQTAPIEVKLSVIALNRLEIVVPLIKKSKQTNQPIIHRG